MFDMLKNMDPPLGFGNKCPYRLAYKKLIRMNMPVDADGKVQFTSTLFALIRENLSIKMRPGALIKSLLVHFFHFYQVQWKLTALLMLIYLQVFYFWKCLPSWRNGWSKSRAPGDYQENLAAASKKSSWPYHSTRSRYLAPFFKYSQSFALFLVFIQRYL